jgi:hypothetical protein
MEPCARCHQIPHTEDYKARRGSLGSPGLHVRRYLCACGCKGVQFFRVFNRSAMQSNSPLPGYENLHLLQHIPVVEGKVYASA